MFEFSYPWAFILLLLPVFISRTPWYYISKRSALRISFKEDIDAVNHQTSSTNRVSRASLLQKVLLVLVYILVVMAMAKPQYIGEPLTKEISQREVLVAIDLSGSMATKDFKDKNGTAIDRLEAVKMVLGDFFTERKGEKIGLILFGNAAFVQAPFTQDLSALDHLLSELNIGMAGPQTAMGDSIGLAVKMFQDSNVTDRMLIVMSDGDDTGSKVPPLTAAKLAQKNGVSIFPIAVGDPKNAGEHPIDTETLKEIAKTTGGKFYYAWNSEELSDIYTQIDKLKPKEVKEITHRPKFDLFLYPLLGTIFLLLGYGLLLFIQSLRESK
ncbi:VWA domain-containing protein [Sulfurovum sp.]|uniref:VWA domain-containing protein n=1 Tax=Sulfurovum sp. TaxID=1969726 RepID=UPI002867D20A|nr:VWA domain-containing protein [Sulfurovum sp.]